MCGYYSCWCLVNSEVTINKSSGDTLGDRAEYVDSLGGKFPSLHLKLGVYLPFLLCAEEVCANISLFY